MEKQEENRFLKEQLAFFTEREKVLIKQLQDQSIQLHSQSIQINELIASIRSLEAALGSRQQDIQLLQGKNRGLGKLLGNKSEKIAISPPSPEVASVKKNASPKERGNNGAKRKEYMDMETVLVSIQCLWSGL